MARPGVTVSTDALTVTEGSTATYTVVLDSEPTGDVVVTAAPQAGVGCDGCSADVDVHDDDLGNAADRSPSREGRTAMRHTILR